MDNNNLCSMCLEQTEHKLECSHYNCFDCLKTLIKKSNQCPICRRIFNIEPYRYIPPQHTPNLKINKNTIRFFNKFLSCRYLLKKGKHQKYYTGLMTAYHSHIFINGKYLNPQMISSLNKYDCLELYVYFNTPNCIFHHHVKQQFKYAIEDYLCQPEYAGSLTFLHQISSLLSP